MYIYRNSRKMSSKDKGKGKENVKQNETVTNGNLRTNYLQRVHCFIIVYCTYNFKGF
jgi:hypothetical protein